MYFTLKLAYLSSGNVSQKTVEEFLEFFLFDSVPRLWLQLPAEINADQKIIRMAGGVLEIV